MRVRGGTRVPATAQALTTSVGLGDSEAGWGGGPAVIPDPSGLKGSCRLPVPTGHRCVWVGGSTPEDSLVTLPWLPLSEPGPLNNPDPHPGAPSDPGSETAEPARLTPLTA